METATLELDGSQGEGGGQILRSSLALGLLTGRAFRLRNIRAGRARPGLQPQHLQSVRAAAAVGRAHLVGDHLGSGELVFEPGEVRAGKYRFDIGTAGATALVLQTIYLPLALRGQGPSEVTLTGGTHVRTAPSFHHLATTWRDYLETLGLKVRLELVRPGFYPRGGGVVEAVIPACTGLRGMTYPQRHQEPPRVTGFSAVAGLPDHIARRQARRAAVRLEQAMGIEAEVEEVRWEGGPGSVLALILHTSPARTLFLGLGERGKPAERVADDALDEVLGYLHRAPALVDVHSADQLVLPLALAQGPSEYTVTAVTRHLTTNIAVIRRFLDRDVVCEGEEGAPGRVLVR